MTRDPYARRRLAALGCIGAAALAAGAAAGAGDGGSGAPREPAAAAPAGAGKRGADAARAAVARLTPAQQAGSLVIMRFHGPALPGYVADALRERRAAGVILFRDNVVSPVQLRALTRAVERASRARALIAVDQEGGSVRTVGWAPPARSQPRQAAAAAEGSDARAAAVELRRAGVNVSLAPVADVATRADSAMGGRVFGSFPDRVARSVAAAVRGWRAGGVLPTAKHFPGLGGSGVNTDEAAATVTERPDLRPWRAAIAAGVPLVMMSHARYPALDPSRIASQSPRVVTGLLRDELGFQGAVMTDSLEAAAVRATGPVAVAAERSVRAGVDLLLTTGRGSHIRIWRHLAQAGRRDARLRTRIAAAAARVLALQEGLR